jgi:Nif-specific regulatory protein
MNETSDTIKLAILAEIGSIIGRALRLESALHDILAILGARLSMGHGSIVLLERDRAGVSSCVSYDRLTREQGRTGWGMSDADIIRAVSKGQAFVIMEGQATPLFLDGAVARRITRQKVALLGVPVFVHGRESGLLLVDRLFVSPVSMDADLAFLETVAGLIGQFVSLNESVTEKVEALKRENAALRYRVAQDSQKTHMVSRSPVMADVECLMEQAAASEAPVLLQGEDGVGRAVLAGLIHDLSERARQPFVRIDCRAFSRPQGRQVWNGGKVPSQDSITSHFVERIEAAHEGTACLENVTLLPRDLQAKLLGVLQGQGIERPGTRLVRRVNVRVLALCGPDVTQLVQQGVICPELYDSLSGRMTIHVPPLRERREDVEALLNHLIAKAAREYGRHLRFGLDALEVLRRYEWPGNVREMEAVVESLVAMTDGGNISAGMLLPLLGSVEGARTGGKGAVVCASLKDMERNEVVSALRRVGWIQYRAAEELGITARQMGYKIKKFGLENMVASERARAR